ncbi:hypothetical protein FBE61_24275 [Salmonella enterica]|nr:hypothetical protein [Salmonella enterica]
MSEIAERKDLRVLEDKKFRWITAKTIQARMIRMNWWCCMFLVLSQYMDEKGIFRPVLVFDSKSAPERAA